MILTNIKSLYLIYNETECYFTTYVSYYKHGQYMVLRDIPKEQYVMERGEFIFRIDSIFDMIEDRIHEANRFNKKEYVDIKNLAGYVCNITIGPGGTIRKSSSNNIMSAVISFPFNSKRLKYGKVNGSGNVISISPCKSDGSDSPAAPYVSGHSESCNKVFRYIRFHPGVSTEELIWMMDTPANRVTPRLTELLKAGRIDICETFINPSTGRKMSRWIAKD